MEKNKIKVMGMKEIKDREKRLVWLFTLGTGSRVSVSHSWISVSGVM